MERLAWAGRGVSAELINQPDKDAEIPQMALLLPFAPNVTDQLRKSLDQRWPRHGVARPSGRQIHPRQKSIQLVVGDSRHRFGFARGRATKALVASFSETVFYAAADRHGESIVVHQHDDTRAE